MSIEQPYPNSGGVPPSTPERDRDAARITAVLAELVFPARTWQLIAQADFYGADWQTRTELARLPAGMFPTVDGVIAAIHTGAPASTGDSPPPTRPPTPRGRPARQPSPPPRTAVSGITTQQLRRHERPRLLTGRPGQRERDLGAVARRRHSAERDAHLAASDQPPPR